MAHLPPRWTPEQFDEQRLAAIAIFREQRMREPLIDYLSHHDEARSAMEELLEATVDLSRLVEQAPLMMSNPQLFEAVRYLAGPPISKDDLKVVADVESLAPGRMLSNPEMARTAVETVLLGLDRQRFPWFSEGREATYYERLAAVQSSAALIAQRRVMTARANESKGAQEEAVKAALRANGFREVPTRNIEMLGDAPGIGLFSGESMFGERRADLVVRLWDSRVMPIECKVSNSSTNSVKRLNNDAAVKAPLWIRDFGANNVVPSAMLAGVFKRHNLEQAQANGMTIWWSHDLDGLISWIEETRP